MDAFLRIWLNEATDQSDSPLLISSCGGKNITIGSFNYVAQDDAYYSELIEVYESAYVEEIPYVV